MQNSFLVVLGVFLGCARTHPLRASAVLCVLLGRGATRFLSFLGQVATTLRVAWTAIDCAIARNLIILIGFGLLTEAAVGGGASLLVVLFLAAKLPWSGGNTRMLLRLTGLAQEPPLFDLAAFEASLASVADAELRRLADGFQAQLLGALPDRQRRELTLKTRALYRTLDQRQQNRQRQKGPGQPVGGPGKKKKGP